MKITNKLVTPEELSLAEKQNFTPKQLKFLMSKTPAKYRREKPAKGGGKLTYVSGGYIIKVLNLMFGFNWDFEILKHEFDLDIGHAVVLGRLTVPLGEGKMVKNQFGRADIKFYKEQVLPDGRRKPLDIGNDLKAAATDALKKCASLIGIAADVYNAQDFNEVQIQVKTDDRPERTKQLERYLIDARSLTEVENIGQAFTDYYGEFSPEEKTLYDTHRIKLSK